MNAFGIGGTKGGESKVVLLDMPGYGKASRGQWGAEIMKYLKGRKQYVFVISFSFTPKEKSDFIFSINPRLRRTFLLIDSLHGLKDRDRDLLGLLRQNAIPHQIILSKVDRILAKSIKSLRTGVAEPKLRELRNITHGLKPVVQPVGFGEGPGALGEILTCSAEVKVDGKTPLGISAIRWSILTASGFDGSVEALKSEPTAS
jgi:GTP-binding protein